MAALADGLKASGLPKAAIQLVPTTDRAAVGEMLTMTDFIDVIVPRGGKSLIERVTAESRVPLFKHLEGNCHSYVHATADPDMARDIVVNAKMRRTGICGATETMLIDRAAVGAMLKPIVGDLIDAGCEVRGDAEAKAADDRIVPATDEDWDTEYLDSIIAVKVVDGVGDAIDHITRHGSDHTDCIITGDEEAAERFVREVDSAIVLVNASTQFADGGEFGMGAEIGISTGKLHARGPVGVEQLTSSKYVVRGEGQIRP
jgi:glutamate-5-semialdehyde dehydrogenase